MGQESRKHKRFSIDFLNIKGKMMFASKVDILDISLGGISLQIDKGVRIGSSYKLNIESKNRSIQIKGTVVWASLKGSRKTDVGDVAPVYAVGIKFDELDSAKINELVAFIESHKEEQDSVTLHSVSGNRFNMRFHLSEDGRSILTCPEDYRVKKISLGGMLIVTENVMKVEQQMPMEIFLPGDSNIKFTGRVASCLPIEETDPKQHEIGIEFLNMPEGNSQKLNEFISMLS
ncbi:MAG: PilZ domain-containing protein [Nitrospirae bacterium]|nr:MAG: PilZ domain-containing protein [Nitrospirota bacterium]